MLPPVKAQPRGKATEGSPQQAAHRRGKCQQPRATPQLASAQTLLFQSKAQSPDSSPTKPFCCKAADQPLPAPWAGGGCCCAWFVGHILLPAAAPQPALPPRCAVSGSTAMRSSKETRCPHLRGHGTSQGDLFLPNQQSLQEQPSRRGRCCVPPRCQGC